MIKTMPTHYINLCHRIDPDKRRKEMIYEHCSTSDLHRFIEGLPTIEPKPIDQTKNDGLRNSRRITETSFIISANSNTH